MPSTSTCFVLVSILIKKNIYTNIFIKLLFKRKSIAVLKDKFSIRWLWHIVILPLHITSYIMYCTLHQKWMCLQNWFCHHHHQCSSSQVPHRRSQCWTVSTNHSSVSHQPTNQRPESAAAANHRPGIPSHGSAAENLLFIVITATKELREHRKFRLFPRHHGAVEGRGWDISQCARLKSKAQWSDSSTNPRNGALAAQPGRGFSGSCR